MSKIYELKPVKVYYMPDEMEEGILYISEEFKLAIHLCACGCKVETVTNLDDGTDGWILTQSPSAVVTIDEVGQIPLKVTLRPSIGNFNGENPYHAHYYITNNKIEWL